MPRANWNDLSRVEIPWPAHTVAVDFSVSVCTLADRAAALVDESRNLAATRDALLPALMSGRLTVRDAENVT